MKTEHTPGPWVVDTTNALGAYGIWTGYPVNPGADGAGYPEQICSFQPLHPLGKEVKNANARLIAAAPDLLAALEEIQERAANGNIPDGRNLHVITHVARAAIAKAKGKTK